MNPSRLRRRVATLLLVVMVSDIVCPSVSYALTSGPSQPEVEGFTPAGQENLVDLFSGNMSYQIPIMDVEGYPIALSYSAGATMDQEATWVGLGWNLSPGGVERSVRGIPDDFEGEQITREMNLRTNRTFGLSTSLFFELFGFDPKDAGLQGGLTLTVSPSFNNYDGVRFETGVSLSMRSTSDGKSNFNAGLGVNASSSGSMKLQPSVGYDRKMGTGDRPVTGKLNIGISLDSQEGLQGLSFGVSAKRTKADCTDKERKYNMSKDKSRIGSASAGVLSGSFDLGTPAFSPEVTIPMDNLSISAHLSTGVEAFGGDGGPSFGGFYSRQKLSSPTYSRPAYGYLHLQTGESKPNAMLDFSREKDGQYTSDQSFLPVATLTNDLYTVSTQQGGGSYRPFRSSVGHVFDPRNTSGGAGGSLGVEVAAGGLAHFGGDIIVNDQTSRSGEWASGGAPVSRLRFSHTQGIAPEQVFFREAGEAVVDLDPEQFGNYGGTAGLRLGLSEAQGYNSFLNGRLTNGGNSYINIPSQSARTVREPRGSVLSYLTRFEMQKGMGLEAIAEHGPLLANLQNQQISEMCMTAKDGSRSYFGIPAYNVEQHDVSFNKEDDMPGTSIGYDATSDASVANENGKDYYYSKNSTPAHAYSYLLTAVVSPDYSDVDGVRGPSNGDLGTWTKFTYDRTHDEFPWRTPVTAGTYQASTSPGLGETNKDNKANYSYGKKEIWYLDRIEGRDLVAVFFKSPREDGQGVMEHGGIDHAKRQMRLDSIGLYTKEPLLRAQSLGEPWPMPIKTAHFDYDYAICPGTPNSQGPPMNGRGGGGKLTLRKVYFTYGVSRRGETSPYVFHYGNESDVVNNPSYNADCQDRWGNLRPEPASELASGITNWGSDPTSGYPVRDFPYSVQDPAIADQLAHPWCLDRVQLPSGGELRVGYESDEYAFVQDQRATRMYQVVKMYDINGTEVNDLAGDDPEDGVRQLDVRVPSDVPADELAAGLQFLYFRLKVKILGGTESDYVSGYAEIDSYVPIDGTTLRVAVKGVHIDKDEAGEESPFYRSALEFARLNYPAEVFQPSEELSYDGDDPPGAALITSMAASVLTFLTSWGSFFQGPNAEVRAKHGSFAKQVVLDRSYVRLRAPFQGKKGGGHRVKSVEFSDQWNEMGGASPSMSYGRSYSYLDTTGVSSGVAAYEPLIGADENCMRRPVYTNVCKALTPDQRFYQEEPFGESLYPAPQVGYARVVVSNYVPDGTIPAEQAMGYAEHEFYTARDFPVIKRYTGIDQKHLKPPSFDVLSLLGFKKTDNMHASQGISIEVNDMHGKAKSNAVYAEGADKPVSFEKFFYNTQNGTLVNTANVIDPDGTVHQAEIGRHYEFLGDLREFASDATSAGVAVNTDLIMLLFPAPIFVPWPKFSSERTRFRSAMFVKKITRFGMLMRTVKMNAGAVVETENMAFDSRTGNTLITKVTNDYGDPVYSLAVPAYWRYDGMGPAYQNIGARFGPVTIGAGGMIASGGTADQVLFEGDELAYYSTATVFGKAWVESVAPGAVRLIDAQGAPMANMTNVSLKVLRSGRRNMQDVNMATLTLLSDPMIGLAGNVFDKVLNAQALGFSDRWRTSCECAEDGLFSNTHNPFRLGQRGVWRPSSEYAYLTERNRFHENGEPDIRHGGTFVTFSPYYRITDAGWREDPSGWVATKRVTDYNIRGQELENTDALGIFSSASFGHRGTLVKSVAKNARYRQQGFEDFEDAVPMDCADRHFRMTGGVGGGPTTAAAHTGLRSVKVSPGQKAVLSIPLVVCDPIGCTLSVNISRPGSTTQAVPSGGTVPYSIAPIIVSGSPTWEIVNVGGTNSLVMSGTGTIEAEFTDANGCVERVILNQ